MSGDLLELIRLGCDRYPSDDDKVAAFVEKMMRLYGWEPDEGVISSDVQNPPKATETAASELIPSASNGVEKCDIPASDEGEKINTATEPSPAPKQRGFLKPERAMGPTQLKVWHHYAEQISSTGLSPSYAQTACALGKTEPNVAMIVALLKRRGYLAIEGTGKKIIIQVLEWPEGVASRVATGRADTVAAKPKKAESTKAPKDTVWPLKPAARQPAIERGPNTCATPDCRFPKQPGRDHCAACLAKKMPEWKRADMVEPLRGGGQG